MSSKPNTWTQIIEPVMRQALAEIVAYLPSTKAPASAFRAYRAAAFTIISSTTQVVPMDAVDYDLLGEFSLATGLWTPQKSGQYLITAGLALNTNQNSGVPLRLMVYKNGSLERYFYYSAVASTSVAPQINGADHFNVVAGDQYAIYTAVNALGGPPVPNTLVATGTANTWFSATQLR